MSTQSNIQEKLAGAYAATHLKVENESHMHSVPANSETHFKVVLVSNDFEGQSKVKRHQGVYSVLADEMKAGVHALALHLYTEKEWASRRASSPDSPSCLGGSKREQSMA